MIDTNELERKLQEIADHYGFAAQANQVMEECGELIQAVAKWNRVKMAGYNTRVKENTAMANLIEELADVQIIVCQLVYLLGCGDEVLRITDKKADRQLERIRESKKGCQDGLENNS